MSKVRLANNLIANKIPAIENLAVTRDQYDTIDLTDNELRKLDNFPTLRRLKTLLVSNNSIVRLGEDIGIKLPRLEMLVLNGNSLAEVEALRPLVTCKALRYLSLIDCPISRVTHYRLSIISLLPQLRALDFRRITNAERKAAISISASDYYKKVKVIEGKEEEGDGDEEAGINVEPPLKIPRIDRERIEEALKNAKTIDEIKQLERILATGHVPDL